MDPSDRLELAGARLEEALPGTACRSFCGTGRCSLDEFDTFNAPKSGCWEGAGGAAQRVLVALCDDGASLLPGDLSLFSGAKQVAAQLAPAGPEKWGGRWPFRSFCARICATGTPRACRSRAVGDRQLHRGCPGGRGAALCRAPAGRRRPVPLLVPSGG